MARLLSTLLVVAALVAGCSDDEAGDYDAEFEADFAARCEDAYDRPGGPQVCGCWYDALSQRVPFEDLPDADDLVGDDFDLAPSRIPGSDLDLPLTLLATCVRELGAEATIGDPVPPPTEPRPPTTPPTTTTVAA